MHFEVSPIRQQIRHALAGLLAIALLVSGTGCCGPCVRPAACGPRCTPGCQHRACEPAGGSYHTWQAALDEEQFAQPCPPEYGRRRPVQRLAHHLKPHGALQPQVPVAPLPKFHPLPTRPVFEPNYFDTVIGPSEAPLPYGPELSPVP